MSSHRSFPQMTTLTLPSSTERNLNLDGIRALSSTNDVVPRRYQDTRPILQQKLSYDRILGIGELVSKKLLAKYEQQKEEAIQRFEVTVWQQAETVHNQAVSVALNKLSVEHEKALKKQHKLHERTLQEEAVRVTGIMQKQAMEQLQRERAAADKRRKAAIEKAQQVCNFNKIRAVEDAVNAEMQLASMNLDRSKEMLTTKLSEAVTLMAKEKEAALDETRECWATKICDAASAWKLKEVDLRQRVDELQRYSNRRLAAYGEVIELDDKIADLQRELATTNEQKLVMYSQLLAAKEDLQRAIDKYPMFDPSQTDYLVPSLANVNLESFERMACPGT